jgi:hypothetical protein
VNAWKSLVRPFLIPNPAEEISTVSEEQTFRSKDNARIIHATRKTDDTVSIEA